MVLQFNLVQREYRARRRFSSTHSFHETSILGNFPSHDKKIPGLLAKHRVGWQPVRLSLGEGAVLKSMEKDALFSEQWPIVSLELCCLIPHFW